MSPIPISALPYWLTTSLSLLSVMYQHYLLHAAKQGEIQTVSIFFSPSFLFALFTLSPLLSLLAGNQTLSHCRSISLLEWSLGLRDSLLLLYNALLRACTKYFVIQCEANLNIPCCINICHTSKVCCRPSSKSNCAGNS